MEHKIEKPPLLHRLATSSWADWLVMHKRATATLSALLVLIIVAGIWMMQARKSREIKDYETADVLAEELQKQPLLFDNDTSINSQQKSHDIALNQFKALVDKYPSLQKRFDSLIAQEYLLINQKKDIDPYAKRAIVRMKNLGLMDYADFSEVSRLSGLQLYKEALLKAQELKKRLKAETAPKNDFTLQSFLLLHMATLNQQLGNAEAMLQNLFELKEHLGQASRAVPLSKQEKELAGQILAHLQENQSSLLGFMEESPKAVK